VCIDNQGAVYIQGRIWFIGFMFSEASGYVLQELSAIAMHSLKNTERYLNSLLLRLRNTKLAERRVWIMILASSEEILRYGPAPHQYRIPSG